MARTRSIVNRRRKARKGPMDLDITSLLDILVILLIFLLRSYNSSGVPMTIPKEIILPNSESISLNTPGIMIQVSDNKIWVESKEVLSADEPPARLYDHGGRRIIPLYDELVRKKEEIKNLSKTVKGAQEFTGNANLIVDKSLKYSYIKKLMYTCAEAGFKEFKFVVLGNE